jgi:uncharacterized lipoprotein YddW (UPF0748 family)
MLLESEKNGLLQVLLCSFAGCAVLAPSSAQTPGDGLPPPIQREFRGLWVATIDNIDWPSQRGLDSTHQKQEMLAILDRASALRLNVVILQVRDSCDAFYDSKIEPWSEYLTGRMGQAPSPPYDPLEFAVAEAHRRGLELHAWFNPYRARLRDLKTPVASNHVTVKHPELVRAYGKYLWLDPSEQGARDYSLSVVTDVVRRYDVDGVHFDDYFYPYPEKAGDQEISFPDDIPWHRYQGEGGKLSRADWRRDNVDRFVQAVYENIKKEKAWVKFGISPFGIWRPSHPAQITGFDSYDKLYGDSRKWLMEGWLDYCAPQLYWPVDQKAQSFPVLLQWWASQNTHHRTLLAGMKINGWKNITDDTKEVGREIELTRQQPDASGEILWHAKPLLRNTNGVADILQNQIYAEPALSPASPWLGADVPSKPLLEATSEGGALKLAWKSNGGAVWQWVLQKKTSARWTTEILPGEKTSETIKSTPTGSLPETIALFAVNRFGNISVGVTLHPSSK